MVRARKAYAKYLEAANGRYVGQIEERGCDFCEPELYSRGDIVYHTHRFLAGDEDAMTDCPPILCDFHAREWGVVW